jgi:hypothetical protein
MPTFPGLGGSGSGKPYVMPMKVRAYPEGQVGEARQAGEPVPRADNGLLVPHRVKVAHQVHSAPRPHQACQRRSCHPGEAMHQPTP